MHGSAANLDLNIDLPNAVREEPESEKAVLE